MPPVERLYYADSNLLTFTASVTDIREYARTDGQSLWQIALDRTAFYPTSGGQPFDRGTLAALARSGAALVAEIDDVVEDEAGELWHATRKPLLAGTLVTGTIDPGRRQDHMQQHSGQHLLSAVCAELLGTPTVSFHLGDAVSSIDLVTDQPEKLLAGLAEVEVRANRYIADNLPVSLHTVSQQQAEDLLAAGKIRKLPPRSGPIRLVEIPGLDLNACGGTHVSALGQIGGLLLRSTEKVKKGVRVEFVCGLRAVAAARRDLLALTLAAKQLSVGREDVPAAVERLAAEAKSAAKAQQRLREDLANYHAVQLAVEERIDRGLRLVQRTFTDRDAEYLKLLASRLVASVPQTVAILVSTMQDPNALVLASSPSLQCGCGARLKRALEPAGLRGGGSADLAQTLLPQTLVGPITARLAEEIIADLREPLLIAQS